ncbi:heat shock protein Hsp20 family protein [Candidatus Magnetoovum chiemensis]|nr:heat shock protein Hsp20 family protein [Candidatus Magnetoovum chiemensis]
MSEEKILKQEAEMPSGIERTKARKVYTPAVDIVERKDDMLLIADMPGVDETSLDIMVEKKVLTIYGAVNNGISAQNRKVLGAEYGIGDYQRSFTLTDEIAGEKIEASIKDGVLKLVLPKSDAAKTTKIAVKAG